MQSMIKGRHLCRCSLLITETLKKSTTSKSRANSWGSSPILQDQRNIHTCQNRQFFFKHKHVHHNLVKPGNVSPERLVPDTIQRPPYIEKMYDFPNMYTGSIEIKTSEAIQRMKDSCTLAKHMLEYAGTLVKPGIMTERIDELVHEEIIKNNAYPSPLLYKGYPKSICTSVNNVACHGIPDDRPLVEGDILNIDITVFLNGYHGDTSSTFTVGEVDSRAIETMDLAKNCRDFAIEICGPGVAFTEIGAMIDAVLLHHGKGFNLIEEFCGHGIGSYFHGPPSIIHTEIEKDEQGVMKAGMTFTIEPIVTEGKPKITILEDGWTAITLDGSRSAQYEHTVLISEHGADILT